MRTDFPAAIRRLGGTAILALFLLAPTGVAAQGRTHTFVPERGYQSFAVREPVLRIAPGDTLISESMGAPFMPEGG